MKKLMSTISIKVGAKSASVLSELAITIKNMTKSNKLEILVTEMNNAAEELHNILKSYPNINNKNEASPEAAKIEIPMMEIIQVGTVVSLIIEIVARVEDIVKGVEELSDLAKFKSTKGMSHKSKQNSTDIKISFNDQQKDEEATIKILQMTHNNQRT